MARGVRLLLATALAGKLTAAAALAQGIGAAGVGSSPTTGTPTILILSEKIGLLLILVSIGLFVIAWHFAGKEHRSRW